VSVRNASGDHPFGYPHTACCPHCVRLVVACTLLSTSRPPPDLADRADPAGGDSLLEKATVVRQVNSPLAYPINGLLSIREN